MMLSILEEDHGRSVVNFEFLKHKVMNYKYFFLLLKGRFIHLS